MHARQNRLSSFQDNLVNKDMVTGPKGHKGPTKWRCLESATIPRHLWHCVFWCWDTLLTCESALGLAWISFEPLSAASIPCANFKALQTRHQSTPLYLYIQNTHYVAARCETEVCSDSNRYVSSRLMTMAFIALPCMRSIWVFFVKILVVIKWSI